MSNAEGVEQKRVWLTWEVQRRNRSMSRLLGAKLFELTSDRTRPLRYFALTLQTLGVIRKERPNVVFAQNPSIVLSLLIVLAARIFSYKAVIDEHNSGLFPLDGKSRFLNWAARFIIRKADLLIVTNQALADYCQKLGGRPVVHPDPLPDLEPLDQKEAAELAVRPMTLVFVCTWADDEPYAEVLEAARRLDPEQFQILITGKYEGKQDPNSIPDSVKLTGFISDADYVEAFRKADGAIILTTRENCMNCGAYEAVALNVPGILSDHSVLRTYFGDAFLYTANHASSIEQKMHELSACEEALKERGKKKKLEILKAEREDARSLESALNDMVRGVPGGILEQTRVASTTKRASNSRHKM